MGDWTKRVWCCASFGEILLIGEQIRIDMHTASPYLVKDHRHMLRTYPQSFIGSEAVDWLLESRQSPTREMAVILFNILQENNVLHHVSDSHSFKDEGQVYRFRKDDGTFRMEEDLSFVLRGKRIFQKLKADRSSALLKTYTDGVRKHNLAFQGCKFVDWLIRHQEAASRQEATSEARTLLVNGVIKHVTDSHHFKDEELMYQFKIDFSRKHTLLDLVIPPEPEPEPDLAAGADLASSSPSSTAQDIPFGYSGKDRPQRSESGYHSDHHSSPPSSFPQEDSPSLSGSDDLNLRMNNLQVMHTPGGVLWRKASIEELEDPHGPYLRRHIRVNQDPVGFGFVIRGEGPVFVKTVDPQGPAAAAGLKVGHYIYSVNDQLALHMNHVDLAHIILDSNTYCSLVVLQHHANQG